MLEMTEVINYIKKNITEFLLLFLFILVVFLCGRPKRAIFYFIKHDSKVTDFDSTADSILTNSILVDKFNLQRVDNEATADITVELAARDSLGRFYDDKIEYYPNTTKQIWFSFTEQRNKPHVYIDEINWLQGVKESGLTLDEYRHYVILHEFMHALGYEHQECNEDTSANGACPVLYQATRGCPQGFKCGYKISNVDFTKRIPGNYVDRVGLI